MEKDKLHFETLQLHVGQEKADPTQDVLEAHIVALEDGLSDVDQTIEKNHAPMNNYH